MYYRGWSHPSVPSDNDNCFDMTDISFTQTITPSAPPIVELTLNPAVHPKVAPVEEPDDFFCPITTEIMIDPVSCSDGHSYERDAIENWFNTGNITSPKTNMRLENRELLPNHTLKGAIEGWKTKRQTVLM